LVGLEARPYIGTWRLNGQQLVQHTPDALVYLNGDTALPGCAKCSGKIDIQRFLTEVSVDAGTEPGSASASFSLSIPLHHTESFGRDAKFLLRPGLEVHVYMRGYFPVQGLFAHLAEPKAQGEIAGSNAVNAQQLEANPDEVGTTAEKPVRPNGQPYATSDLERREQSDGGTTDANMRQTVAMMETLHQYYEQQGFQGVDIQVTPNGGLRSSGHSANSQHHSGSAVDFVASHQVGGRRVEIDRTTTWASINRLRDSGHLPSTSGIGLYLKGEGQSPTSSPVWGSAPHMDGGTGYRRGREWIHTVVPGRDHDESLKGSQKRAWLRALQPRIDALPDPNSSVANWQQNQDGTYPEPKVTTGVVAAEGQAATQAVVGPSLLEEYGLAGQGIENTLAYPYYHVFHGVVTEVSHSYSGGVNTISVNCSSMLHFWQYHNMSTNASVFGARPRNSKLKMSLVGHNFTGMHPYQIMYSLHHDMVGAAGGVAWALASKSNTSAVSEVGQESLFSLNIRYWERRFSGRAIRLRMHGATGELFSTMAAAWLGRTSSTSIMRLMRNRFNIEDAKQNAKGVLEQAQSVGLYNVGKRKALAATRAAFGPQQNEANKPRFELNIVEMQAFVSNIGNWGQVNLFESSYESKLDVAQKVMEITGFEFYQDVDGDFVFKPPMWNLDTSSSRVYRLEDIDIINISFSEKEPQVTYMTCKGSQFKNLGGTGLENEWGVRGQYIDYRLVAQFGWRPGTYETAYFNDSKSMFFSAVNRMDVMNIGINACQVTIPVRPELRPGFPVYIPYLDAYYYCNSFVHAHAVGGQCTTSLTLVGKRAKFYAPGNRPVGGSRGGIDDIKLGDTVLPQRPLQVIDPDGKPRLSGFPNVVMALDPTAINPLFFVVGNDLDDMSDVRVIKALLKMGQDLKVLQAPKELENGGLVYVMTKPVGRGDQAKPVTVQFYFQEDDLTGTSSVPSDQQQGATTVNIVAEAIEYERLIRKASKSKEDAQEDLDNLQGKILDKQARKSDLANGKDRSKPATITKIEKLDEDILALEKQFRQKSDQVNQERKALEASWRDPNNAQAGGVAFLLEMRDRVGASFRNSAEFQGRGDLSSTINLLDMLSDKKATFSNGSQPGNYRYYSASHPDPAEQGPKVVSYVGDNKKRTEEAAPASIDGDRPTIKMFTRTPNAPFSGAIVPEAELVDGQPEVGIKVLDSSGQKFGRSYPTSAILELMFSVQPVTIVKSVTTNFATTNIGSLGKGAKAKLSGAFANLPNPPQGSDTIEGYFGTAWSTEGVKVAEAIIAMKAKADETNRSIGAVSAPAFPASVTIGTTKVAGTTVFALLKCKESPAASATIDIGAGLAGGTYADVVKVAAKSLGSSFYRQVEQVRRTAAKAVVKSGGKRGTELDAILGAFNNALAGSLNTTVAASNRRKGKRNARKVETTFSPVFPVSDARGYEVIGTYRYGRDVSIEPDGVFDQLHKSDIFSLLDKKLVEQILQFFVQNRKIRTPPMETVVVGGKTVTRPVEGAEVGVQPRGDTARYLNDELIAQLRARGLTDKQILDYGFLLTTDDPNQLQFSLANIFSENKLDGVQKIPVINAAYSLADMNVQQSGHICDCKAAEADVLLSAYGHEQFLSFSQSGTPHHEGLGTDPADAGTRWVAMNAAAAADSWRVQQQALRGQVLDRGGSHIVRQTSEAIESVQDAVREARENFIGVDGEQSNLAAFADAITGEDS